MRADLETKPLTADFEYICGVDDLNLGIISYIVKLFLSWFAFFIENPV